MDMRALLNAALFLSFGSFAPVASSAADLQRGQYLVEALMACDTCHTPRGADGYDFSARFSGGSRIFTGKDYVVRGSNISPDAETGVGAWSDETLGAAIVAGVGRKGALAPVMPSDSYRVLTANDLAAIIAFLRAAPPVKAKVSPPEHHGAGPAQSPPGGEVAFDEAALSDKIKRGFYIASIARCLSCHSGEKDDMPDYANMLGAGGKLFRSGDSAVVASNITPHREHGVGAWSDAEIKRAITQGVSRKGEPLRPPMSTLARNHFAKMTPDDLDALVAYLRTMPAKE